MERITVLAPCENHPDRAAVSSVNIGGVKERRCAECVRLAREAEREDWIEMGWVVEEEEPRQLLLFERAA